MRPAPFSAILLAACFAAVAQPVVSVPEAAVVEVTIAESKFLPAEVRVRAGTSVRWTNREKRTSHSVLFIGPGGLESDRLFPGESWSRKFDKPGRHVYTCGPHPEMRGVIEVAE